MKKTALYIINSVVAFALIITLAILIWKYSSLPNSIPVHFDMNGVPNRYSGRASIFVLYGICVGFYALMLFVQKKPHLINMPVPTDKSGCPQNLTKEQRLQYLKVSITNVSLVLAIVIALLIYCLLGICQLYKLNPYFPIIHIVAIALVLVHYFYRINHLSFTEADRSH